MKKGFPPVRSRIQVAEPREARVATEQIVEQLGASPRRRAAAAAAADRLGFSIHCARNSGRKLQNRASWCPSMASTSVSRKRSVPSSNQWRSSSRITFGSRSPSEWMRRERSMPKSWRWRSAGSASGAGRAGSGTPRKSKTSGKASSKRRSRAPARRRSSAAPRAAPSRSRRGRTRRARARAAAGTAAVAVRDPAALVHRRCRARGSAR